MAMQQLLRFAACEHREVIDEIKQAMTAAPFRQNVSALNRMPSMRHAVSRAAVLVSGNSSNEMRRDRTGDS